MPLIAVRARTAHQGGGRFRQPGEHYQVAAIDAAALKYQGNVELIEAHADPLPQLEPVPVAPVPAVVPEPDEPREPDADSEPIDEPPAADAPSADPDGAPVRKRSYRRRDMRSEPLA